MPVVNAVIYGFLAATAALLLAVLFLTGMPNGAAQMSAPEDWLSLSVTLLFFFSFLEEGSKWIFFRQLHKQIMERFTPPSPLTMGMLFGLGFSSLEVGLIVFGLKSFDLFPLLGIIFLQTLTSLFYAYYLFRQAPRTLFHTVFLVFFVSALHLAYNLFALRS